MYVDFLVKFSITEPQPIVHRRRHVYIMSDRTSCNGAVIDLVRSRIAQFLWDIDMVCIINPTHGADGIVVGHLADITRTRPLSIPSAGSLEKQGKGFLCLRAGFFLMVV